MSSKPKIPKRPSQLEIWKGIRKDPVPPASTHQRTNRKLEAESAKLEAEMLDDDGNEIRCAFCGELRFAADFDDGLRCRYCTDEDDEILRGHDGSV